MLYYSPRAVTFACILLQKEAENMPTQLSRRTKHTLTQESMRQPGSLEAHVETAGHQQSIPCCHTAMGELRVTTSLSSSETSCSSKERGTFVTAKVKLYLLRFFLHTTLLFF